MTQTGVTTVSFADLANPNRRAESAPPTAAAPATADLATALAEPYAFALVQWPAVLAIQQLPNDGALLFGRIAAGVWLALALLAAYGRGRGAAFGNVMVFSCGLVAGASWTYPSAWTFAWAPALLIGLYSAQRARLKRLYRLHPERGQYLSQA
jgi:hypothetical protein